MNKRGLSTIIIVLILVGLSLVAVGIIWGVVADLLKTSGEQSTSQFGSLFLDLRIINVKILSGEVSVTVQRNAGEGDLEGIVFLFATEELSESARRETTLDVFETEVFSFELEKIEDISLIKEVSIAPVVSGGAEKDIIDTYELGEVNLISKETFDCTVTGCEGDWICQNKICVAPSFPSECTLDSDCPDFYECSSSNTCVCVATCSDLGYSCGMQSICGKLETCGPCPSGKECISAVCENILEEEEEEDEEEADCSVTGCEGDWICESNGECVPPSVTECSVPTDCPDFHNCIDNECVCDATCSDLGYSCGTQTVCGQSKDCGLCPSGQYCSAATCIQDVIINSGTVGEVFPSSAKLYFSSADLPNRASLSLFGKYINFSGVSGCRQITYHGFIGSPYNINYLEFDSIAPELQTGMTYSVWNKTECGS
jgi:hypothetical protein